MIKGTSRPRVSQNLPSNTGEAIRKEQVKLIEIEIDRLSLQRELLDRRQRYLEQQTADFKLQTKEKPQINLH